jgi:putative ABC transport system permease protein
MTRTFRLIGESIRSLRRNRFRAVMMLIASTLGIAALIVITGLGRGTQDAVMDSFARMFAGNTMFLRAGTAEFGAGRHATLPSTTLTITDLVALRDELESVTAIDPMIIVNREVTVEGGASRNVNVEGHGFAADALWARPATQGAFFTAEEEGAAARVALVGTVTARELFEGRSPIGQQIRIGNVPFEVIGVLGSGGIDPHGVDRDDVVWIPISTMQRRVLNVDFISTAKLGFAPNTDLDYATLDVSDLLRRRHALEPGVPNDFQIFTPVALQERIADANRTFTVFLPLATLFAILVGAFVIANLMFLTVSDRRSEIGLRKALGARAADIRAQFLAEALVITTTGGVLAVVIAFFALRFAPLYGVMSVPLPISIAAIGIALSIVVGLGAGVAPARRAAALDPVDALR